jgi:elongation factor Ts
MAVTAEAVKQLRERTGAGMMECKKALVDTGGDLDAAAELMRKSGLAKADKKAARVAAEGVVVIERSADAKRAVIVEVNCETDFVAKNEDFLAFAKNVSLLVCERNPADAAALAALPLAAGTIESTRTALIGKIGENVSIRRFARMAAQGRIANYVHGGAKVGVIVDLSGGDPEVGRDIAMHIAASKPKALRADGVPAAEIERERAVALAKAAESGKPAEIRSKMVDGSVQKFLKEVTLLSQPFVKDDKMTIEQLLKSKGATVNAFALFVVGEGIERKQNDFAAEVAAQAAAARG